MHRMPAFRNMAFAIQEQNNTNAEFYGAHYLDWIVYDLKPYIDQTLRTLPGKETTFMAGSSAGANISFTQGSPTLRCSLKSAVSLRSGCSVSRNCSGFYPPVCRMRMETGKTGLRTAPFIQCGTEEGEKEIPLAGLYQCHALVGTGSSGTGHAPRSAANRDRTRLKPFRTRVAESLPRFFRFLIEA